MVEELVFILSEGIGFHILLSLTLSPSIKTLPPQMVILMRTHYYSTFIFNIHLLMGVALNQLTLNNLGRV